MFPNPNLPPQTPQPPQVPQQQQSFPSFATQFGNFFNQNINPLKSPEIGKSASSKLINFPGKRAAWSMMKAGNKIIEGHATKFAQGMLQFGGWNPNHTMKLPGEGSSSGQDIVSKDLMTQKNLMEQANNRKYIDGCFDILCLQNMDSKTGKVNNGLNISNFEIALDKKEKALDELKNSSDYASNKSQIDTHILKTKLAISQVRTKIDLIKKGTHSVDVSKLKASVETTNTTAVNLNNQFLGSKKEEDKTAFVGTEAYTFLSDYEAYKKANP